MQTKRNTMQPTQQLTPDQAFFFMWAGYSHDPRTETAAQGRTRCAIELAAAEERYLQAHRNGEASCVWNDDQESAAELRHERKRFESCEYCMIVNGNGVHLASLHAITDANPEYKRVVRAELAYEAFPA